MIGARTSCVMFGPLMAVLQLLLVWPGLSLAQRMPQTPDAGPPQLSGRHFRITVVEQTGYVDVNKDEKTGELRFSGYLMDVLKAVSRKDRGNFTYDLLLPSGFGSGCIGRLDFRNDSIALQNPDAYNERFWTQYTCGESDVNDRPLSAHSTDMYWSLFYITTKRMKANKFTVPYSPPTIGTLAMMGTITGIQSIPDLVAHHSHLPVCAFAGTAYIDVLVASFPELDVHPIDFGSAYKALTDGTCDIVIGAHAELTKLVLKFSREGNCLASGMPIGMIGDPLDYGLDHFAFGVRPDLPDDVLATLNFWLTALMTCFPDDPNSFCSEQNGGGSLSQMFEGLGGTGNECGYELFPTKSDDSLSPGAIAAIVVAPVVVVVALAILYHMHKLKAQEKRMKKRFIQQLARNIDIGQSARDIPAEKLAEAFKHIGGEDGMICKQDLARWMNDLHMEFMSERDFERLWDALDMDGKGVVDPIDFIGFLSQCGEEFKEVHKEYSALPKTEKLKLATRRLSNFSEVGEEGVMRMERRNNRKSRQHVNVNLDCLRSSGVSTLSGLDE